MTKIYAWKTGAALGLAVGVGYAVFAVLFSYFPMAGEAFRDALATGAGLKPVIGNPFPFRAFIYSLALILIWGFATGGLFAWIHTYLHRSDTQS